MHDEDAGPADSHEMMTSDDADFTLVVPFSELLRYVAVYDARTRRFVHTADLASVILDFCAWHTEDPECGDDSSDLDQDSVTDLEDNCPITPNTDQSDSDGNGVGDACERVSPHMNVSPKTLGLASRGRWITTMLRLPDGYAGEDVLIESVRLENTWAPEEWRLQKGKAMFKFDRTALLALLKSSGTPTGYEMELELSGFFKDGRPFVATDVIRVR